MKCVKTVVVVCGLMIAGAAPPAEAATVAASTAGSSVVAPPSIDASSYVVADGTTGKVLAAKDPHGHFRPASTLKVLTAVTLIPRLDATMVVHPTAKAVNTEGTAVGLSTKWTYPVRQLFYGLLMDSGNDCSVALADANGGMAPTLAEMNAEAKRLRAKDTRAATPDGLDDQPPLSLRQQRSSAYDLALMFRAGLALPDFRAYLGRVRYNWQAPPTAAQRKAGRQKGGWPIETHDHLLWPGERYPGMLGGKNGYTVAADGTFVGAAERNGHLIIVSLMHDHPDFWPDARRLLDWGFAADGRTRPVGALAAPAPPNPAPMFAAVQPVKPALLHAAAARATTGLPHLPVAVAVTAAAALSAGLGALTFALLRRRSE
jgi:serine-type D-Ala-D-Ala carboxypeptidase (penicillin-binding protein 5/6)